MANSNGWGDGASNNLIGWGQGADNAIGWGDSHLKSWAGATDIAGFDSAAISYFNATGISGATQQDAIDNLIRGLKDDGIWSKMKAVYPFVTDNRNLLGYSEDFADISWTKSGQGFGNTPTVTSNAATAPNGTLTADRVQFSRTSLTSTSRSTFRQSVTTQQANSNGSIWLKSFDGTTQYVTLVNAAANNGSIQVEVTNEWKRFDTTFSGVVSTSQSLWVGLFDQLSTVLTADVLVWGAQLELGSAATTYQPIATTQQAFIANQFKYNLVNPLDTDAAFRLVFNGGWTHSSNGALPNGTNGFADTKLLGNTNIIKGNFGFGIYSRTNSLTNGAYGVDAALHIYPRFTDSSSYYRIFNGGSPVSNGTSLGLFSGFNDATNTSYAWLNAVKKQTLASPSTIASLNLMLSGNVQDTGGYDNRQLAFAFASEYLNDTQVSNLYTRVQAFQTALSRNV